MPALNRYWSGELVHNYINKNPIQNRVKENRNIYELRIPIYVVQISDTKNEFSFKTEINKIQKSVHLELANPKHNELQTKYPQLKNFVINDSDTKPEILVHIILGVSDYTRIKTPEKPRVDLIGELIAELMKFGWVFVSPEFNSKMTNILFSKTSQYDYENLGCLDCLGIEENHVKSDYYVHEKN